MNSQLRNHATFRTGTDCEFDGAEFRSTVTSTALALERLSLALVPAYAEALNLPTGKWNCFFFRNMIYLAVRAVVQSVMRWILNV